MPFDRDPRRPDGIQNHWGMHSRACKETRSKLCRAEVDLSKDNEAEQMMSAMDSVICDLVRQLIEMLNLEEVHICSQRPTRNGWSDIVDRNIAEPFFGGTAEQFLYLE